MFANPSIAVDRGVCFNLVLVGEYFPHLSFGCHPNQVVLEASPRHGRVTMGLSKLLPADFAKFGIYSCRL